MIKTELEILLKKAIKDAGIKVPSNFDFNIEKTQDAKFGDYSTNIAMRLAKIAGKNPMEVADKIGIEGKRGKRIKNLIEKIEIAKPGFINFYLKDEAYINELKQVLKNKNKYGSSKTGTGQKVMVEYSAPNVNKYLHLGHARNDFLGMALSNILEFCGYKVIRANYFNDRGINIAKAMLMYERNHNSETPEKLNLKPDIFIGKIYAEFETELKKDPALKDKAEEYLRLWEAGDKAMLTLWKKITAWAYKGFNRTYHREGSKFDINFYESQIYKKGKAVVEKYLKKEIFIKAKDGHIFIDLTKFGLDKKVLIRSDGTAIYITSDLVLAEEKEKLAIDKSIYVVDIYQSYHFKTLFKIFELLGYKWADKCFHLGYGYIFLRDKKMSSRAGNVIPVDELIDNLKEKIKKIMANAAKKKVEGVMQKEKVAESLALGAAKFGMLKYEEQKDIRFVPDETIKLEGETGPYLQYTYARIQGIFSKCQTLNPKSKILNKSKIQNSKLKINPLEKELMKNLVNFGEVVEKCALNYKPHFLCTYLYELAQSYNSFYNSNPVLKNKSDEVRNFRLMLCEATGQVLQNGLRLLGISTPEKI